MNLAELTLAELAIIIGIGAYLVKITIGIFKPNQKQDSAISLLKEQLNNYKENTANLIKAYQNDLHEVKGKIDGLDSRLNENTTALSVLTAIIEERMPKK